jgi:rhamnose utilization protein RhaD (predicted bifunctional aldolase and dehydrogenase)
MNDLFPNSSELIDLAHRIGAHPARLALWTEGAVAARLPSGKIAVSTAGSSLAHLHANDVVELDLAKAQAFITADEVTDEDLAEAGLDPEGPRPCGDLFAFADLFAFEGVRFAAHTQPVAINQITCSPRARQFADRRSLPYEIISCGPASVLAPFAPPGLPLAKEIKRRIVLWQDRYRVVHGMIALGETVDEVLMLTEMTIKFAEIFIGAAVLGGPDFLKPVHVSHIEANRVI